MHTTLITDDRGALRAVPPEVLEREMRETAVIEVGRLCRMNGASWAWIATAYGNGVPQA